MMKLSYLLTLLLFSTGSYAVQPGNNKVSMGAYLVAQSAVFQSFIASQVVKGKQPLVAGAINDSFFTEFQLPLKNDWVVMGQWTRLHKSYNNGDEASRTLRPLEWSLVTESRTSTAKEIGLNWTVYGSFKAYVKLQTVNSSAWIPQVSIPRFMTQDTDKWTLASAELVYRF